MTDAVNFVAFLFTDVVPYTLRELASVAISNPVLLALAVFGLWSVYVVVSAVLRHVGILALIGGAYAVVVVLQRYLLQE